MSRQYPIWHDVSACHYNSKKSYGGQNNSIDKISVGSSSSNSYHFAKVEVKRTFEDGKCYFRLFVDNVLLKEMIFTENGDKAGTFIKKRTKLNSIKGLK